jgi:hypothetical protein
MDQIHNLDKGAKQKAVLQTNTTTVSKGILKVNENSNSESDWKDDIINRDKDEWKSDSNKSMTDVKEEDENTAEICSKLVWDLVTYVLMLTKVQVNGIEVEAILNTGAGMSIINNDLAKKLQLDIDVKIPGLGVEVLNECDIMSEGAIIDAPICIGTGLYPDHLVVNKQTKPILLLGMSWFKHNHAYPNLDWDRLVIREMDRMIRMPAITRAKPGVKENKFILF